MANSYTGRKADDEECPPTPTWSLGGPRHGASSSETTVRRGAPSNWPTRGLLGVGLAQPDDANTSTIVAAGAEGRYIKPDWADI